MLRTNNNFMEPEDFNTSNSRELIKQLEMVFKNIPIGITVEDRSGNIIYANDFAAYLFGYSSSVQLKKDNIKEVFAKFRITDINDKKYRYKDLPAAKVFRGKKVSYIKLKFTNKKTGDESWFKLKGVPVNAKAKKTEFVIKTFENITKLVEEQKNREIFLGMISHELKGPLSSIIASCQLIRRKYKSKNGLNTFLNNIERQTDKLLRLVNDMLDTTRISMGEFKINKNYFKFDKILDEILSAYKLTNTIKIERTGKAGIKLYGDEKRIAQVIENLISNAIKYSRGKGKIVVNKKIDSDFLTFSVKDEGIGISKQDVKYLFKPLSKLNKDFEGAGLGLFISKSIVEAHQGDISVVSSKNKGAKFEVRLPLGEIDDIKDEKNYKSE